MVGVRVPVTVVDQKGVVVDAVEEVNHLMDSEGAGAVVVQQSVERLKLRSASAGRGTAGQGEGGGSAGMGGQ